MKSIKAIFLRTSILACIYLTAACASDNPPPKTFDDKVLSSFKSPLSEPLRDSINIDDFCINKEICEGDKLSKIIKILGTPDSSKRFFNEIDGVYYKDYYYKKSIFSIEDNRLISYNIQDSIFVLEKLGLRIGQGIDAFKIKFLRSFNNGYLELDSCKVYELHIKNYDDRLLLFFKAGKLFKYELEPPDC